MSTINENWQSELFAKTIKTWGERAQFEMAQEEATELALAVRKWIRKGDEKAFTDLAGEIADVEIMIAQMKVMQTSLQIAVNHIKLAKLERLEKRLEDHTFES